MNDTLTIFHKSDLDGLCCEAIARRALGDRSDYLGFEYGEPIPDLAPYSTVYLLDISLPLEVMETNAGKIVIVDHHRTLIDAIQPLAQAGRLKGGYLIEGVAACRLAWQWFAATDEQRATGELPMLADYLACRVTEPYAVQLLGRYDVWDRAGDENVDLFQLGMQAEKAPDWDCLFSDGAGYDMDRIIERGRTIQAYTEVTNAQISTERGFDVMWEELLFRALCTARCNSLTFAAALRPEHDGCLAYHWNGRAWRFSLYQAPGKEHHDLSVIAKKYGGGGHAGACGFQLTQLPTVFGGWPVQYPLEDGYDPSTHGGPAL